MAARKAKSTKRKDPKALAAAVARVQAGESVASVARDLGWAQGTIARAVKAAKAPGRALAKREGKGALPLNGNGSNPHQIGITGLRDYVAFEVARQLPDVVTAEMAKRFRGGS